MTQADKKVMYDIAMDLFTETGEEAYKDIALRILEQIENEE